MNTTKQKTQNVYIILERGSEYNDEIYYFLDGGDPHEAYINLNDAETECNRLNNKWFKENNPFEWGYDLSGISSLSEDDLLEGINKLFKTHYDDYEDLVIYGNFEIPTNSTNEQITKFRAMLDRFYNPYYIKKICLN